MIFRLPEALGVLKQRSPLWWNVEETLVYVHWFSKFKKEPGSNNGMYVVEWAKATKDQEQIQGAVVPLANVRQCCMLSPASPTWDPNWESHLVLDQCRRFYVNNFQSNYSYYTIY